MLVYLLKSSACLAIFILFYKLLLERENMHVFKRFYLLGSLLASFVIPTFVFVEYVEPLAVTHTSIPQVNNAPKTFTDVPKDIDTLNLTLLLWTIYGIGALLFGVRFFKNLSQIVFRIRRNPKIKHRFITKVLLRQEMPPHTFFRYVFLNKKKYKANTIPAEVLIHEETHARQGHSYDILFIELLRVVFWFNPLIHWLKRCIKLNHEFLADRSVLKQKIPIKNYQRILLSFLSLESPEKNQSIKMANSINYPSIKNRFAIMNTRTSKKTIIFKSLLLIPLISLLLFGFTTKKVYQEIQTQSSIEGLWLDEETENSGISIVSENNQLYLYQTETYFPITKYGNSYHVITEYVDVPISLDTKSGLLRIGGRNYVREANSIKKKFEGTWTDSNGEIKLKIESFTDGFIWTLTKDGLSNKFYPKKSTEGFQISYGNDVWDFRIDNGLLIDSEGRSYTRTVESMVLENISEENNGKGLTPSQLATYNELAAKYKKNYYGESRILVEELNTMHVLQSKMNEEQKTNSRTKYGFPKSADLQKRKTMPQKQIEVYNDLAKKYNDPHNTERTIPFEDLQTLQFVYRRMTMAQKAKAQPFPEILSENQENIATREQMKEYDAMAKKYSEMPKNHMRISTWEVERMKYLHGLMSKKQKADALPMPDFPKPPAPPTPPSPKKASLEEQAEDITSPPSPPEPINPLDHVIEMTKKGAEFYYESKRISSTEAIEIVKQNKKINVESKYFDEEKPVVRISKSVIKKK